MIVVHGIVAWLDAYGIGANDVANAFGEFFDFASRTAALRPCAALLFSSPPLHTHTTQNKKLLKNRHIGRVEDAQVVVGRLHRRRV